MNYFRNNVGAHHCEIGAAGDREDDGSAVSIGPMPRGLQACEGPNANCANGHQAEDNPKPAGVPEHTLSSG